MYLDANNLYRWAMPQPLPTSNFKWLTDEEIEKLDVMMVPDDKSRRYILECDLGKYYFYYHYIYVYFIKCSVFFLCISEYPLEWSTQRSPTYPWTCPDRKKKKYLATINVTCYKMKNSANLHPSSFRIYATIRTTLFTIYCNLKLYLELGLRLTSVYHVLLFDQSPWLENYININTRQRTTAKNDFEKDFVKLINNTVFGKSFSFLGLFVLMYWFIHCFIHCR